jgi:hypothetical protein
MGLVQREEPAMPAPRDARLDWPTIIERSIDILASYADRITLRQLFYRLVAEGRIPNTTSAYKYLSRLTAIARRAGRFPRLVDRTRRIDRQLFWDGPAHAKRWLAEQYLCDRTAGQMWTLFLVAEKDTVAGLLSAWYLELGVRVFALRGYSSESLAEEVRDELDADPRPGVLLYVGDHDPSGEHIDQDFIRRVNAFSHVERVALTAEQVEAYDLPPMPGKDTDARAADFEAKHGVLRQVEVEALPPEELRRLYDEAIASYFEQAVYDAVLRDEDRDRRQLTDSPGARTRSRTRPNR